MIVRGATAEFAVHSTLLADGSPTSRGSLRMSFRQAALRVESVSEAPSRPGIFLGEVSLPEPGVWEWSLELNGEVIEMPGWQVARDEADLQRLIDATPEPGGITVLKEQQWPIRMRSEVVQEREITERVAVLVRVSSPPDADTILRAPVSGSLAASPGTMWPALATELVAGVQIGSLRVPAVGAEGVSVAAWGAQREAWRREVEQALATSEAEVLRLTLALDQAARAQERVGVLYSSDSAAARELEEAVLQKSVLAADLTAANGRRDSWRAAAARMSETDTYDKEAATPWQFDLFAPFSGRVVESWSAPGMFYEAGAPLLRVHDGSRLWLTAMAPIGLAGHLDQPTLTVELSDGFILRLPGSSGRMLLSEGPGDAEARALPVVFECGSRAGLSVGGMLAGRLGTQPPRRVTAIPISALVDEDGVTTVYVHSAGEAFERRVVSLGIRDGAVVEVLSGVAIGERVVSDSAYVIRLISLSGAIPEHSH